MGSPIALFLLCFLVAGALGGVLGWLLRGTASRREVARAQNLSETELDRARAKWSLTLEQTEERFKDEVATKESALRAANEELGARNAALTTLRRQMAEVSTQLKLAKEMLDPASRRNLDLAKEPTGSDKDDRSLEATERRYQSVIQSKDGEIERLRARITRLEASAAQVGEPKPAARPRDRTPRLAAAGDRPPDKDDLKRIKGIGPVLERLLNEMGCTSFHDISTWGPEEIETVARKLDVSPGRIERDDWVSQAKRLYQKEHGTGT